MKVFFRITIICLVVMSFWAAELYAEGTPSGTDETQEEPQVTSEDAGKETVQENEETTPKEQEQSREERIAAIEKQIKHFEQKIEGLQEKLQELHKARSRDEGKKSGEEKEKGKGKAKGKAKGKERSWEKRIAAIEKQIEHFEQKIEKLQERLQDLQEGTGLEADTEKEQGKSEEEGEEEEEDSESEKFDVTTSVEGSGGSIKPFGTKKVPKGASISIKIQPDSGNFDDIADVTINGVSLKSSLQELGNGDGHLVIHDVTEDLEVVATFSENQ